jgi:hypothetical protein
MAVPQQPLTFNDVFDEEEVDEPKAANSVHHIRANSSIMQLKKILGMCRLSSFSKGSVWTLVPRSQTGDGPNCLLPTIWKPMLTRDSPL